MQTVLVKEKSSITTALRFSLIKTNKFVWRQTIWERGSDTGLVTNKYVIASTNLFSINL